MFIKQVKISGFKPFGETTVFGDFSPKKNCIYGLNGSGKSSFFSAIEFVFLDEFSHLRPSDRQSLLYSGKSFLSSPTAYVEIIFDNTAQRLPIKDNEVTIRRSIGINKDEYFIQRKHSTRQDLINLFDSANYSIGSGLFSVRQGRVKTIAEMTDADRIELIFEVSGMRTYDEQRKESLSMLKQAKMRREKIGQAIEEIHGKLEQIQKEKQELEEYEKVMKIKKAIEYIICEDDRAKVDEKLGDNELNIANEKSVVSNLQSERIEAEASRNELENELRLLNDQIQQNEQELKISEQKGQDLVQRKARSDCLVEMLKQNKEEAEQQLDKLQEKKEELVIKLQNLNEQSRICKNECDELNSQKIRLESILNRNQSFQELEDEIYQINQQIEVKSNNIESYNEANQDELDKFSSNRDEAETLITQKTEEKRAAIEENKRNQSEKIKGFNERKLLFKKQFEYQKFKENQEHAYQKAISDYEHLMGETSEAIRYIKKNFNEDDGFYGQLIDLIDFDESLNAAIDSTAGRRLFYVVVETDDLATQILDKLKNNHVYGQVNFLLLNRIQSTRKNIETTQNCKPLIDFIQYDQKVKGAVELVFGSIALCTTINVAAEIADLKSVTCVTMEGDTAHYSGVITGGYISNKRSICKAKKNIDLMREQLEKAESHLEEIDQKIKQTDSRLKQIDTVIKKIEDSIPIIDKEIIEGQSKYDKNKKKIKDIENGLKSMQNELNILQNKKQNLEETLKIHEKESSITESITSEDKDSDSKKLCEIASELAKKKIDYQKIAVDLNEYNKKFESIDKKIAELQKVKIEELGQKVEKEARETQDAIEAFEQENDDIKSKKKSLQAEFEELNKRLRSAKNNEKECRQKLQSEANRLEELKRTNSILTAKREEILKSITNIGPLPLSEIEEYKEEFNSERKNKYEELRNVNSQLQTFRFVNKKAIEQFKQFERHEIELNDRLEDIDKSIVPIKKLIAQLDKNKEKAVTRTCSIVSNNFSQIYQKLDPTRTASLILTTQDDSINDIGGIEIADDEFENENSENEKSNKNSDTDKEIDSSDDGRVKRKGGNVLNLTGMAISVNGEKIEAMSGGEKTLVAIALLFAIQQTEANPFYLLDEIDSDLDINARQALAIMIDEMTDDMSKQVQFIYTTHRSEMMEHADKFFAMKHTNDSSIVKETDYEDAAAFIADGHADGFV